MVLIVPQRVLNRRTQRFEDEAKPGFSDKSCTPSRAAFAVITFKVSGANAEQ